MGWKGTMRSLSAAARSMEREALRRERELERQHKQLDRTLEHMRAMLEVQRYEDRIDVLQSVHKDCGDAWDWKQIHSSSPPPKPEKTQARERSAQAELDAFKPGLSDRFLRRTESKREELVRAVEEAKIADEKEYQDALKAWERDYADWEATRDLARRILEGDLHAFMEALEQVGPFREIPGLGSSTEFYAEDCSVFQVTLHVNDEEVIPRDSKSLLKSGKLSVKPLTKTKFYALYQDYVCGCVLRVARELLALLPVEMVIVNAVGSLLNTQTGYMEERPILSVGIPRETLEALNFEMLDPSDSMTNFVHRMNFRKTQGFRAVDVLTPDDFQANN